MQKIKILKSILRYSLQYDLAYFTNGWSNIISVIFFMLINIIFIDIVFQNINSFAGYSRDELLLFNLLSQFWAFILMNIFLKNFHQLSHSVNSGELDLILTKPIDSLFFVCFRNLNIINMLRDLIPSLILITVVIKWDDLNVTLINLVIGLIIALLGIACSVALNLLATLPVFWLGYNQAFMDLSLTLEDSSAHSNLVYEALGDFFKIIFTVIFPSAISTAIATSVILDKSNPYTMLFISIIVTTFFIFLSKLLWGKALKVYNSASS